MNDSALNIWTIAKRELSGYFASPVAYVFIVIFLLLTGFFTFMLGGFFERGEASLASFFMWHPWLYLFLVPAAGMRLWSEERRLHTMELLLTMPITAWQAIVGKFLASWLFLILALALTFPIVFTVCYLGDADLGVIFTGYIGSALLAGGYLAVACMTSAMTRNQVISFILSVVICFFLILCGWEPVTSLLTQVNVRSPWIYLPYCLIVAGLLFAGSYACLPPLEMSSRIISALAITLATTGPAAMKYVAGTSAPMGLFYVGTAVTVLFEISLMVWIFRAVTSLSTPVRVIVAVILAQVLVLVLASPWLAFVFCLLVPSGLVDLVSSFSVMPHFIVFQRGLLDSLDLTYFILLMSFPLFITSVIIRNLRAG